MTPSILIGTGAAVFLPLFPLSVIFNTVFAAVRWTWLRIVLLLVWPQLGLWLLAAAPAALPAQTAHGVMLAGLATAVFYAWRMLSVRALPVWVGFWATSAWALAWVAVAAGAHGANLHIAMAGISLTAAALLYGVKALADRWGEAYLGLRCGLGRQAPRLAGFLVVAVLAALGTPLLPVFFVMLWLAMHADGYGVAGVLAAWLLWSWSAAQIWQALLFGADRKAAAWTSEAISDLSITGAVAGLLYAIAGTAAAMIWSTTWLTY